MQNNTTSENTTIEINESGDKTRVTQTDIVTEEFKEGPQIKKGAIIALAVLLLLAGGAYVAVKSKNKQVTDTGSTGQILGENTGLVRDDQLSDGPNLVVNNSPAGNNSAPETNISSPNAVKPVPNPTPVAPTPTAPVPVPAQPAPQPSPAPTPTNVAVSQPTEKIVTVPALKLSVTIPVSWYADLRATSGNELFFQSSNRTSTYGSIEVFADANETIEQVYEDLISDPTVSNITQITINGQPAWQFNRSGYSGRLIALVSSNNVYILKGVAATTSFIPNIRFN